MKFNQTMNIYYFLCLGIKQMNIFHRNNQLTNNLFEKQNGKMCFRIITKHFKCIYQYISIFIYIEYIVFIFIGIFHIDKSQSSYKFLIYIIILNVKYYNTTYVILSGFAYKTTHIHNYKLIFLLRFVIKITIINYLI